jgi:uncharacterized protein (TIGR03067 family)
VSEAKLLAKSDLPDNPPPGGNAAINPERFSRTYADAINNSHQWFFKGKKFVLAAGDGAIPPDLLKALLGPDRKSDRVTGEWALNPARTHMIFTAVVVDGKPGLKEARLGISPAGLLRVNLEGGGQYNTMHFEAKLPQPKGVVFPGYANATKIDRAFLRGTWAVESRASGGKNAAAADFKGESVTVTGDSIAVVLKNGVSRGTVQIDAVPVPGTVDITFTDGPAKGDTYHGVYVIDGDRLTLHLSIPGGPRPEGFDSKTGENSVVRVLGRVKE